MCLPFALNIVLKIHFVDHVHFVDSNWQHIWNVHIAERNVCLNRLSNPNEIKQMKLKQTEKHWYWIVKLCHIDEAQLGNYKESVYQILYPLKVKWIASQWKHFNWKLMKCLLKVGIHCLRLDFNWCSISEQLTNRNKECIQNSVERVRKFDMGISIAFSHKSSQINDSTLVIPQ